MDATWTWGLGPWIEPNAGWATNSYGKALTNPSNTIRTTPDYELPMAHSRSITVRLWEPDEASFQVVVPINAVPLIKEGETDLFVRRNGYDMFRGRVMRRRIAANGESASIDVTAQDYRALLDVSSSGVPFKTSEFTVAAGTSVVDTFITQLLPAMAALGLEFYGGVPASSLLGNTKANVVFKNNESAWKTVQQLLSVSNYFDMWIDGDLKVHLQSRRGLNNGFVLDYLGNVDSFDSVAEMNNYANSVVQFGAETQTVTSGRVYPLDGQHIILNKTSYPEGIWTRFFDDTNLTSAAAVTNGARAHLDEMSAGRRPTVSLTMRPGAWEGPESLWIGDTVRVWIQAGEYVEDYHARVHEMTIGIDAEGQETVALTLWRPKPSTIRVMQEMLRRHQQSYRYSKGEIYYG